MGVVYRARQISLNRPVAVKMLLGGRYTDPVAQARFLVEAEVIARLRHPHVVQVYEFGRTDDQPYFVLEFVGGGSLAGKLKADGRFAPRPAAALVAQLADAMAAAHAQGIIHRDLKPANVLLTEAGEPKVTDFGLAKLEKSEVTASGAVLGTPSYMSPEQAAGKTHEVGTATDVYALGAVLYELLTGRPPFRADSAMATMRQVLEQEPARPRACGANIPRDLETVCLKCLEKEPRQRYPTAEALAADLRAFLDGRPIAARPVGLAERLAKAVRRRPAVAGLVILVVLAVLGGVVGVLYQYHETDRALGVASANAELYRQASEKARRALANETAARASEQVATLKQARNLYTAHMNLVQRAWERADLQHARELLERHIPEDAKSPDFRGFEWYFYWRLTHAATPTLKDLPGTVRALAVSPDGRTVAIACATGSALVWETAGGVKPVALPVEGFVSCLAYSPDGKWLAAGTGRAKEPGVVHLLDAGTHQVRHTLKGHSCRLFALAFTPDGQTLVSAGTMLGDGYGTPWTRYYDIETARPSRGEIRLWDMAKPGEGTAAPFGADGGLALAVSPSGRWLAVGRADGRTLLVDLPARKVALTLGRHQYPVWAVAVSDDAQVVTGGGQWDRAELLLWTPAGTGQRRRLGIGYKPLAGKGALVTEVLPGSLAEKCGLRRDDLIIEFDGTDLIRKAVELTELIGAMRPGKQAGIVVKRGTEQVRLKLTAPVVKTVGPLPHESAALVGHTSCIQATAFTRDGARLLTVSLDRSLRVWHARTGRFIGAYRGHTDGLWALGLLPDGRTVLTGGGDRAVFTWDLRAPQEYREIEGGTPGYGSTINESPADGTFLQSMRGCKFQIDADTGQIIRRLSNSRTWRYTSAGNLVLLMAGYDKDAKQLSLYSVPHDFFTDPSSEEGLSRQFPELLQSKPLAVFRVPPGQARDLSLRLYSANGSRCLLVLGRDRRLEQADDIQIWNIRTAAREPVAIKPRPRVSDFSPTGRYLYAYYWNDNSIHVWDLDAGRRLLLEKYPTAVSGAHFSPAEKYVAAATHDGLIRVWKTEGMRLVHTLRTRAEATWGLRFSKDERTLLASNWDGRIRLWDLETGEERLNLGGPDGAAHDVAITPDGRTVIGAYDGTAVIWRAAKDGEAPKYRRRQAQERRGSSP